MREGWTYKKLGEVCRITSGFTPKAADLYSFGSYPYFKVADMNTPGNEIFMSVTSSYLKDSKKYFTAQSIVFPKNGATIATNKKRILAQDSIVDLNTAIAEFSEDVISKYAYYWFVNVDFKDYMRGGALPTLDLKSLKETLIPLPPKSQQEAIVSELDEINSLLALKREQLQKYDKLAQSLFYEMFGDPVENEKGWEEKKWKEVLSIINGKNQREVEDEAGLYPICGSGGIMGRANSYLCPSYCTIIGRKGNINKPIFMKEPFWNVDTAFGLKPDITVMDPYYLFYFCKGYDFEHLNKAVTIPSLTKADLLQVSIPLPPLSPQQQFASCIEQIESQKQQVQAAIEKLETLLASRMQYWFE